MAPTVTRWGPGEPASLEEITSIFDGRTLGGRAVPWWLAGGYAIELAVGQPVRDHGDIDVLLLRRDQFVLQEARPGWDWQAVDPPERLRPWRTGEHLPAGVRELWGRLGLAQRAWLRDAIGLSCGPEHPWRARLDGRG